MSNGTFIPTNLLLDRLTIAIRPSTRFIGMEGPARSAKTALAIQILYYALQDPERNANVACIGAKNLSRINQNILNKPDTGLLATHPDCYLQKDKVGGYYVAVPACGKIKRILLAGYDNKTRWQSILGADIDIFLIDEANIAVPTFLDECEARQLACEHPLTIYTTNGDDPNHYIYQNRMNYGRIVGNCPTSTRTEIEQFQSINGVKPGYYYMFFGMADNPIMTPEKLERALSVYPVGSYYYKTKILGERGVQGELIYNDYMDQNKLIIDAYEMDQLGRPKYPIWRYTIGVDIGASKAHSVFVLVGWTTKYKSCIILRYQSFQNLGYELKRVKLKDFVRICVAEGMPIGLLDGIAVDSAEMNFIRDIAPILAKEFGKPADFVYPAWKATIKERIDMNIIGFSTGRVQFHKDCRRIYQAFETAKWAENKIGEERLDLGTEDNDLMDATEYAQTRHMKTLMREGD